MLNSAPIFDALDDELGFRGLVLWWGCGSVGSAQQQMDDAQNLRCIKQRKGIPKQRYQISVEPLS